MLAPVLGRVRAQITFANVVAVLALFVALGSTGVADPVVHTAGNNVKNALRLSKKADKKATRALRIARQAKKQAGTVRSQQSLPGPKGQTGDPGVAGPPGPSEVFSDYFGSGNFQGPNLVWTLGSLTLPPGSYVVEANASFTGIPPVTVTCAIGPEGFAFGSGDELDRASVDLKNKDIMALTATVELPATDTVEFGCFPYGDPVHQHDTIWEDADMAAIKVGRVSAGLSEPPEEP
jgi:hypothetical protein